MKSIIVGVTIVVSAAALGQSSAGSSISGSVVSRSAQAPVAGAQVIVVRHAESQYIDGHLRIIGRQLSGQVATGPRGEFKLAGLPDGEYHICAQTVLPNLLGSCEWGHGLQPVKIFGGQPVTELAIVLEPAVTIGIEVDDPKAVIVKKRISESLQWAPERTI